MWNIAVFFFISLFKRYFYSTEQNCVVLQCVTSKFFRYTVGLFIGNVPLRMSSVNNINLMKTFRSNQLGLLLGIPDERSRKGYSHHDVRLLSYYSTKTMNNEVKITSIYVYMSYMYYSGSFK